MSGVPIGEASNYATKLASKMDIQANNRLARTAGFVDWDVDDLAEAYLEAFRELGHVVGVEFNGKYWFFGPTKQINEEIMHFHNALLDAAEDEGWDVEEMATLGSRKGDV